MKNGGSEERRLSRPFVTPSCQGAAYVCVGVRAKMSPGREEPYDLSKQNCVQNSVRVLVHSEERPTSRWRF